MILRHEHTADFTVIPNNLLRDGRLALRDVGLLCSMLSLPDDWEFSINGLTATFPNDGEGGIRASLKRIKDAGYLRMERQRDELGKIGHVVWIISDSPCGDLPHVAQPRVDLPHVANQGQTKNRINKEPNNKEPNISTPSTRTKFTPPTLAEVEAYAQARNSSVDPKAFYDYFDAGGWKDRDGRQVRSWKQKLITWEKHEPARKAKNGPVMQAVTPRPSNAWLDDIDPETGLPRLHVAGIDLDG